MSGLEDYRIPEKTCPVCGKKCNKRTDAKYCDKCGARIYTHRIGRGKNQYTIWVTDEGKTGELASYIVEKIKGVHGGENFKFLSHDHRMRQLGAAKLLYDYAEGNLELATTMIDYLFSIKKRSELKIFGNRPLSITAIIAKYNLDKLAKVAAEAKTDLGYSRAKPVERQESRQVEMF